MLYSNSVATMVLGCLMNNPTLLLSNQHNLNKDDFRVNQLHMILFVCVNNLAQRGLKEINGVDIGEYVESYKAQKEALEDNDYLSFIDTIKELANADNLEGYVGELKKFSLLRKYKENGFNIDKFYDESKDEQSQQANLNKYEISDIIEYFDGLQVSIKREFDSNNVKEEMKCGDGFYDVKEAFKETPYFGADLQSNMQTMLYRGWCKGQVILRSAPSGFGKTILAVGDLCTVGAKRYWDEEKERFISNPNYQGATLFINTEMNLLTELTPMFVAWISNVSRSNIADGKYEVGEEERVNEAIKILEESEIYLVDDPYFTIKSLEYTLRDYKAKHNIQYVVMDYLQDNGILSKEMKKTHEIVARDTIILNLADNLKNFARELDVGILTSTQLNGNEKLNEIIDESCLAGGKAVKNKIDVGSIIMFPRKKELKMTEGMCEKRGFGDKMEVNLVSHNYKVRFGKFGTNIKLFQHADLGTGRIYDLYATKVFNEPIKIPKINRN